MKKTYILPALFFVTLSSLASCNLTPTVTGVELDKTEETLFVGSSTSLNYLVSMSDGSLYQGELVWTTSDENVATVNNGLVEGIGEGEATVTLQVATYTASCVFTVEIDGVATVTLDQETLHSEELGEKFTLVASGTHLSGSTYLGDFEWTSNNENVATVSKGVVTTKGHGTATITASVGEVKAEATITVDLSKDKDAKLEAENYATNPNTVRYNANMSGGAYVGGNDNCGNGVRFTYFSFVKGVRTIEIHYLTGEPNSFSSIYINGVYKTNVSYPENTGWGGTTNYETATATVQVELDQGWNDIDIIQNGTDMDTPAWGGHVELDYIVIKATETAIDPTIYQPKTEYYFEAEHALAYTNSVAPAKSSNSRCNYFIGGLDNTGQGVTFLVNIPAGEYTLKLATGAADLALEIATIKSNKFEGEHKVYLQDTGSWDVCRENDNTATLTFEEDGLKEISVTREADSVWFTLDYILLIKN